MTPDENDEYDSTKHLENNKINDLEQEKIFLKDANDSITVKTDDLERSKQELENKLSEESKRSKELEQEKIILEDFIHDGEKRERISYKRHYVSIAVIALTVSAGFVGYSYYENHVLTKVIPRDMSNYNSNYVIQNLQGDTVDTWVSWNIENGRTIRIHVVNNANLPQNMIDSMKDAILSTKIVSIDDSQTGKGSIKGSASTYYAGWEGAVAEAYSAPTKLYIPQKFDINGSPESVGDIEIILTNDVNPDGYSAVTKTLVDNHQILKAKITVYKGGEIDADWLGAVVRHEFGHALGLGHSNAKEDLMSPMLPDYPYISECDIDAIKGLYDGDSNSKVICQK